MHFLTKWFTHNPVAANLVTLLVVVGGFLSLRSMRIEGFPALPPRSVTVTTIYPGSVAEQVDRGVTRKIEKALEGLPGLKKSASVSEDGVSSVWLEKESGFDLDRFQNEIRTRLDAIATLPQGAERPLIARDEFNVEALIVQLYGEADQATLQKTARALRDALQAHPQITKMNAFGLRPYEVRLEVDEERLRLFGLSSNEVAVAVQNASLDYRTGTLRGAGGQVVIRADEKAFRRRDFAEIPLRTLADGSVLTVADVAQVTDGFVTDPGYARFQGRDAVGLQIFTSKKGHLFEVSRAVREVTEDMATRLPAGVHLDIWGEYSIYMKDRLALLAKNAWQGLLIVFVLLALFLDVRLAFWVAAGIPISIAGALLVMGDHAAGYSLNDITTFGMIIVLGILVDDAIVVGESVYEERRRGGDAVAATIRGVQRVSTATIFGCLTTIAAFAPLLLIDSDIGKIFASFAVVVIIALAVSLLESKWILPAHLAAIPINQAAARGPRLWWSKLQARVADGLRFVNERLYQPLLGVALRHRYSSMLLLVTLAVGGLTAIEKGWVRTVFFPEVPGQIITVRLKMEGASPLFLTEAHLTRIEQAAAEVNRAVQAETGVTEPPIARIMTALTGPLDGEVYAELQPEAARVITTQATINRWRAAVGRLEGVAELSFSGSFETGGGFVIELEARDEAVLQAAVKTFTAQLTALDGLADIRDDLDNGTPELRLKLKPEARHLGLTTADLAAQIGDAFGGYEVQRMQRDGEEVKVMVQVAEARRRGMRDVRETRVQTRFGSWLPLPMVATFTTGYAPSALSRQNGRRVAQISADLDPAKISAVEAFAWIKAELEPELKRQFPDLTIRGAGELEEIGTMQGGLRRALLFVLLLIYVLLAIPLKSYTQPLVIMAVIPFGFIGAVLGHWVYGVPLSLLSFFGMLAVTGVVVNDSLVLLTRFNELHRAGTPLFEALIQAGGSRFRAILLTTVTTCCGLLPLLSETSEQAQYLIPAAISLACGELFATPITLIIVPVMVHLGFDAGRFGRGGQS